MKRPFLLCIILSFVINAFNQDIEYKAVDYPDDYRAQIDVIYTKVNDWEGRMDLYTNPVSKYPTPIVINIHGGGWNHGVKESQRGYGSFFKNGYAVANVEYRLVDVATAPGAIDDVRCALIYLYKHSKELNIDTEKIVVMGGSAGGHLALMAGLLGNNKRFDSNCEYEGEIKVAAIINKYGIADLIPLTHYSSARKWLGEGFENKEFTESVSPFYQVTENSPPIFIVHGTEDPVVPYEQSVLLHEKLKNYNIKTDFISIEGGKHGKFSNEENAFIKEKMWVFLKEMGFEEED